MNSSSRDAPTLREVGEDDATTATVSDASSPRLPRPTEPDPYVGTVIDGRYAIEAVLGEGGMGVVYLARHRMIDKKVALKILRADMMHDLEMVQRFINEARAASSIGSAHIVNISDFGQTPAGATYFVMEFLDGRSLGALVHQGRIPPVRLAHIARQMGEALAAAHDAGIVHRDLKPDNVMLVRQGDDPEFVKLLDFGIAKVTSISPEEKKLTRAGAVFGTPHYMSPEQAEGATVDHRSDIYSLGIILFEMAASQVPFDAESFMGILSQHMHKAPPAFESLDPPVHVSPGLKAVIYKCLQKSPALRYQSMLELVRDLDAIEQGVMPDAAIITGARLAPLSSVPDLGTPPPLSLLSEPREGPRWGMLAGVAVSACALSVVIAGVWWASAHGSREPSITDLPPASSEAALPSSVAPTVPASPSASTVVQRKITTVPAKAKVLRDGIEIGLTPLKVDAPTHLVLRRAGYADKEIDVGESGPDELEVNLSPAPSAKSPGPAPKPLTTAPAAPSAKPISREDCQKAGKSWWGGKCEEKIHVD